MVDEVVNLDVSPAIAVLDDLATRIGSVGDTGGQAMADAITQRLATVNANIPVAAADTDVFTGEIDKAVLAADGSVAVQVADAHTVTTEVTDAVQSADTKVQVTGDTAPLVTEIDRSLSAVDGKVPVGMQDPAGLTSQVTDAVAAADGKVQASVADPGAITADIQNAVGSADVTVPVAVGNAAAFTDTLTSAVEAAKNAVEVKVANPDEITTTIDDSIAAADTTIDLAVNPSAAQGLHSTGEAAHQLAVSGKEATEAVGGLEFANVAMKASANAAEGSLGEMAATVGETLPRVAALTGGITAVSGVLTEAVHAAAQTADANRLMASTFGEFKDQVEHIDLHGFNASLKEQTLAMGGNVAAVEIALSRYGNLAQQTGATSTRTKEFVQNILLLTERAVALNPSLGSVESQIDRTGQAISRGGRFAQDFNVNLSQSQIEAEAAREGFTGLVSALTPMEQQIIKVNAAANQLGDHLGTDIKAGSESATVSFRRFRAELEEGLATAGGPLLVPLEKALADVGPVLLDLVRLIGQVAQAIVQAFGPAVDELIPVLSAALDQLTTVVGALAPMFSVVGGAIGAVAGALGGALIPAVRIFVTLSLARAVVEIGQAFLAMAADVVASAAAFAVANPELTAIAVAVTVAVAAFEQFTGGAEHAVKANDQLTESLVKSNGAWNDDTKATLANNFAHDTSAAGLRSHDAELKKLGISHLDLINAANGDEAAQRKINATVDAAGPKYLGLKIAVQEWLGVSDASLKASQAIAETNKELAASTDTSAAALVNRSAVIGVSADSERVYAAQLDAAAVSQANAAHAAAFGAVENANQVAATQEAINASREQDKALRDKIGVVTDTTDAMTHLGANSTEAIQFLERAMEKGTVSSSDFADEARRLGVSFADLQNVIPAAKQQFDIFTSAITEAGKTAGSAFGGLPEAVKAATKDASTSLDAFLTKLEDDLNAQATFAEHLNELISRGFGDIATVLAQAGPEKGALAAAQAVQETDDQLRTHQTVLDQTLEHQKTATDGFVQSAQQFRVSQIAAFSDAATAAQTAGGDIDSAMLTAQSAVQSKGPDIASSINAVGDSFSGLTPDAAAVGAGVTGALDAVTSPIDERKDAIGTKATAVGDAVQSGLTPGIADVLASINAALDQIKQALTDQQSSVLATAVAVGDALSAGMAQGVSAGAGHVVVAAQGVAAAAIAAAKDQAGIASPSQVMADEVGVPLVEGIAAGVKKAGQGGGPLFGAFSGVFDVVATTGKELGSKGGELIGSTLADSIATGIGDGKGAAAQAVADLAKNTSEVSRLFGRDLGVNLTEDLAQAIRSGFFKVDNAVEDVIAGAQRNAKAQLDQVFATLDAGQSLTSARDKLNDVKKQYDELLAQQLVDTQKFGTAQQQLNAAMAEAQSITAKEQQNIERAQHAVAAIQQQLQDQQDAANTLPQAQRELALDQAELARLHGNLVQAQNNALLGTGTQADVQSAQQAFTAQQTAVGKSQQSVDQLTAKMKDNRVTQNDLTVAQQDLAQVMADAVGPTDAVRQAQQNLKDVQDQATATAQQLKDVTAQIPVAQLALIKSTEAAAIAGADFNQSAGAGVDILKQLGEKAGIADTAIAKLVQTWGGLPSQLASSLGGGSPGAPPGQVDVFGNGFLFQDPTTALQTLNFVRQRGGQDPLTQQQAPWNPTFNIYQANDPTVLSGSVAALLGLQAVR